MANPQRGEFALKVGDRDYTLRFSANALCELEDALGLSVLEITEVMTNPMKIKLKTVRALMWAGLQEHHPQITLKMAGDIIQDLTMVKAMEAIGKAIALAFPTPDPPQPGSQPAAGTGPVSSAAGLKVV